MKDIAIVGAGGFGREVKMLIDQINSVKSVFNIAGFYDDKEYSADINGVPYLGDLSKIEQIDRPLDIVIAIGDPTIKKRVVSAISNPNISFPNLIHPGVLIGKDAVALGRGNVICAGNILTVNIAVGDFVILNLACTVGHDTEINDYCSFMPGVNISGEVKIEESVYVGTGAKIINQLTIGEGTIVGAGAVVSKSLPSCCTAVGIPAKPIKFH
ncbi:MAG: acetyltransferase [Chryseobacterium sp.]|nr:MAG: acetyltransferase [Chryseobacterium sp.]